MKQIHNVRSRTEIRNSVLAIATRSGVSASDVQYGRIRMYAILQQNESAYTLHICKKDSEPVINTEERLIQNDAFVGHAIALEVVKLKVINGKPVGQYSVGYSYPDPNIFTAAEAEALETIFNANFKLNVDQKTRLEVGTNVFRSVPDVQATATTLPSKENPAFKDLTGTFLFMGGQNNNVELKMKSAEVAITPDDPGTVGYCNAVIVEFDGFTIKNGATKQFFDNFLAYTSSKIGA